MGRVPSKGCELLGNLSLHTLGGFFPSLQTYLTVLSEDHVSWSYFKDWVPQSTFGISL